MKMKVFRFAITCLSDDHKEVNHDLGFVWAENYIKAVEKISTYAIEDDIIEIKLYEIESWCQGNAIFDDDIANIINKYDEKE